jgi:hypothetical protein
VEHWINEGVLVYEEFEIVLAVGLLILNALYLGLEIFNQRFRGF